MSKYGCDCCNKIQLVPRQVVFEKPGNVIWSVPRDGWYKVTLSGAGGGGGAARSAKVGIFAAGGAGGGGATAIKNVYLKAGMAIEIVVGAGGKGNERLNDPPASSTALFDATSGGTSSFGIYCSATGGGAGYSRDSINNHAGATASTSGGYAIGGDQNFRGEYGQNGYIANIDFSLSKAICRSSIGGSSKLGQNPLYSVVGSLNGRDGFQIGCGGYGGIYTWTGSSEDVINTIFTGGNGADGAVIIEWTEVQ